MNSRETSYVKSKREQRKHHSPGLYRLWDQALIIPDFGVAPVFYLLPLRPKVVATRSVKKGKERWIQGYDECSRQKWREILCHAFSLLPPPPFFFFSFFHHLAFSKSWEAIAKVNEPWPQADAPHISLSHRALPTLHPPFPTTNLTLVFQRGTCYIYIVLGGLFVGFSNNLKWT